MQNTRTFLSAASTVTKNKFPQQSDHEQRLLSSCIGSPEEMAAGLGVSLQGLTTKEAEDRLDRFGANELTSTQRLGFVVDIFRRLRSPLVVQLLVIALVSVVVGELAYPSSLER